MPATVESVKSGLNTSQTTVNTMKANVTDSADQMSSLCSIANSFQSMVNDAQGTFNNLRKNVEEAAGSLISTMSKAIDYIVSAFNEIKAFVLDALNAFGEAVAELMNTALGLFNSAMNAIAEGITDAFNSIKNAVTEMGKSLMNAFKGASLAGCSELSSAAEEVPANLRPESVKNAVANKGKTEAEAIQSSLKNSSGVTSANALSETKNASASKMSRRPPTLDEIKSQIGYQEFVDAYSGGA
jgi:ABC-type transporter Mla subunit MlaD